LLHSREDELVPFDQAERLFAAAREPKYLVETSGGHNESGLRHPGSCVDQVNSFLDEALEPSD